MLYAVHFQNDVSREIDLREIVTSLDYIWLHFFLS